MSKLTIPYLQGITTEELSSLKAFESLPINAIDQVSWNSFPYKPQVSFKIAYSDDAILLNYEVEEKHLRINSFEANDPVYEDSCVEFFISFQNGLYYNLEFNAIGVALVGYGSADKSKRERISKSIIDQIKSHSKIESNSSGEGVKWNLSLYIPFEVFERDTIQSLSGKTAKANFYKCGDLLPEPHFVSWKPISNFEPNFHLPEFFGEIEFQEINIQ